MMPRVGVRCCYFSMSETVDLKDMRIRWLYVAINWPKFNCFHILRNIYLLARDAFVRTNRRAIVMMFVRPSVCMSVCVGVGRLCMEVVYAASIGTTTDDLEWSWMAVSRIARYLCGSWASCIFHALRSHTICLKGLSESVRNSLIKPVDICFLHRAAKLDVAFTFHASRVKRPFKVTQGQATCTFASAVYATANPFVRPSVCLFVCPLHFGIQMCQKEGTQRDTFFVIG